ncbi:ATP-grasp fold amidoligase family protein [Marinilactibacillus sp. GCM10026970]|uniref:ATP-grasp fold amidoligase family protein n=1 Tax=Marinilactibacillus sp. GCM10026970 TaxID=3252642 RepID=UPI003605F3AB
MNFRYFYHNHIKPMIPDKFFVKRLYENKTGKKLNLKNPETFNEKIQWMKINYRNDLLTTCVDKYKVRTIIENRLDSNILNELYGVYNSINEIDIDNLPNEFVMKTTAGWGDIIICRDKSNFNWNKEKSKIENSLNSNNYEIGREWAYKNVNNKIIVEKLLLDNQEIPNDYKFFCFNGKVEYIQVDSDRFSEHKRNLYDVEWNLLNVKYKYPNIIEKISKPINLDRMIEISKKLSEGFPFVRVDLYSLDTEIIFGELTFYPESGMGNFVPEEYDLKIGSHLKLDI